MYWSISCLMIISFFNFLAYRLLLTRVYTIKPLEEFFVFPSLPFPKWRWLLPVSAFIYLVNQVLKWLPRFILSIIYTAIIFFGLKMDLDKFHKPENVIDFILFVYILLVYTLGLFCTGYIVNIIFVK